MTSDGRWNYTWDAENRLIKVESRPDTPQGSWRRIEWTFDALGRRIQQVTLIWTNNAWFVVENLKFVSDPMLFGRHIVELNATNNTLVRSYAWGLDLSGSLDGAGGVGGLTWVTLHTTTGPASGTHFTCYDGNGNIVSLVSATTGDVTARYEYGPFGETIRVTGPAASLNPFRFSTKRTENNTDLVLYEYRAYSPSLGRWLSRDLIEEKGSFNLYIFASNNSIDNNDYLGLFESESQDRTDAVKENSYVREDVSLLLYNMLSSRNKKCTKGKAIERKRFNHASKTFYAFMYFTSHFYLGQVSGLLEGKGFYEVDCCKNKFGKWEIVIRGTFRDDFDQLIRIPFILEEGFGSLPITFVGEWYEFYSGKQ